MRRPLARLLLLAPLAGCELAEVATAPTEEMLVVEAVLRAGEPRQFVLLHRTIQGSVVRGEPGAQVAIRPAGGQDVLLRQGDLGDCADGLRAERIDTLRIEATCYIATSDELAIQTGVTYELRVTAQDGRTLRGRTTVPGNYRFRVPAPNLTTLCTLRPMRQMQLVWTPSPGAWSYIASMQLSNLRQALRPLGMDNVGDRLELTGLAISERDTTMLLPAHFGVFERAEADQDVLRLLQEGFPAGVRVDVALAAADRNFVNGVRGGSFNPSGAVRISSVVGDGVGVFGSLVVRRLSIHVGNETFPRPCLPAGA